MWRSRALDLRKQYFLWEEMRLRLSVEGNLSLLKLHFKVDSARKAVIRHKIKWCVEKKTNNSLKGGKKE